MIHPFRGMVPTIHPTAFVADSAQIVGDVVIGKECSIWFNAVIRGDVNYIRIGDCTNVQDGCLLHVRHRQYPLILGSSITVGHGAILHGCVVEDHCLVGMGAVILDNAKLGQHVLVAAGSVVRENMDIPGGVLVAGVPARVVRNLKDDEKKILEQSAENYIEYVRSYKSD